MGVISVRRKIGKLVFEKNMFSTWVFPILKLFFLVGTVGACVGALRVHLTTRPGSLSKLQSKLPFNRFATKMFSKNVFKENFHKKVLKNFQKFANKIA